MDFPTYGEYWHSLSKKLPFIYKMYLAKQYLHYGGYDTYLAGVYAREFNTICRLNELAAAR